MPPPGTDARMPCPSGGERNRKNPRADHEKDDRHADFFLKIFVHLSRKWYFLTDQRERDALTAAEEPDNLEIEQTFYE